MLGGTHTPGSPPGGFRGDFRSDLHTDVGNPGTLTGGAGGVHGDFLGRGAPPGDFRGDFNGDFRSNWRGSGAPAGDFRGDFRGPGGPSAEFRGDFHGPGEAAGDFRRDFRGPGAPLGDERWDRDFRSPGDHEFPAPWRGGSWWGDGAPPWGWGLPPRLDWDDWLPGPPDWGWGWGGPGWGGPGWGWGAAAAWDIADGFWDAVDNIVDDVVPWIPGPYWSPAPFDYYGFTVIPIWDPDFQEWGFWEAGIWIPLPGQPYGWTPYY
jgi:hypothetical protein